MTTENKVTEIFCIAVDFCKVFDAQMEKYTINGHKACNRQKLSHVGRVINLS